MWTYLSSEARVLPVADWPSSFVAADGYVHPLGLQQFRDGRGQDPGPEDGPHLLRPMSFVTPASEPGMAPVPVIVPPPPDMENDKMTPDEALAKYEAQLEGYVDNVVEDTTPDWAFDPWTQGQTVQIKTKKEVFFLVCLLVCSPLVFPQLK